MLLGASELMIIFMSGRKPTVIMLKILCATIQNTVTSETRCMGFVVPCYILLFIHLKVSSLNKKRNNIVSETCTDLSLCIYKEEKTAVR